MKYGSAVATCRYCEILAYKLIYIARECKHSKKSSAEAMGRKLIKEAYKTPQLSGVLIIPRLLTEYNRTFL